jgi:nucleolar protein 12
LLPQRSTTPPEDEDASEDELSEGSEDESGGAELDAEDSDDNDDLSSGDEVMEDGDASDVSMDDEAEAAAVLEKAVARGAPQDDVRKRKRKQRDDDEDLEAKYFERLENEDEPTGKRRKADSTKKDASAGSKGDGEQSIVEEEDDESADEVPVHESLAAPAAAAATPAVTELEKANRTVFLSNVSVEAITSSKAKKTLLNHLASVLDKEAKPAQKVESIRFRSTAFETAAIPKRAAYIKKEVLSATTRSTNAYAVYSTTAAARVAVAQLNGTVVLDRHLRVDSVAHPAPVDHRRCVFVGNLGFVDDETVYNTKVTEEGKEVTEKRKRTKTPMDVEEGLWQVFGKEGGKVESVRVVRDAATRVGKGFAYVQFYVSPPPFFYHPPQTP